ncbi:MAG: diacylglycerol kinase [Gemmatimonadota bacterium]|nr:diacylglycerol kinase [Gemmatimonadota bacterium]
MNPSLPAYLNKKCGSVDAAREALSAEGFELEEVEPDKLVDHFRDAVKRGVPRMVVAGGDGTIAAAAAAAARSKTELAVLPGGTLNHFARDNGIPTDLAKAAEIAGGATIATVDLGYLDDKVFLNTSSIGLYVKFVRVREQLETRLGYRLASLLAAFRMFSDLRMMAVKVEIDGKERIYRTPLVFIGVSERELQLPTLGSRVKDGRRGLHVMVVRGRRPARLFALALAAVSRGTREVARTPHFESFIADKVSIALNRPSTIVALDGELHRMDTPLEYRIERDALKLVVAPPQPADEENETGKNDSAA